MAFVAPVLKKDYDIFATAHVDKNAARKKKRTEKHIEHSTTLPEITAEQRQAMEIQLERRRRMELLRDRRQRRYPRKAPKLVLRKISEINEETEEELLFDEMQKGFTQLRKLTEENESDVSSSEKISELSRPPKKEKKKRTIFGLFYWSPFSFRKKSSQEGKDRV